MTKLIDSIDPEIIVRIGLLITVLGFLIWLCGEMPRACL